MLKNFAVNTNTYHGFSLHEALVGISQAGFSYVELAAIRGWTEHILPEMSDQEISEIKKELQRQHITCIGISGHCNLMEQSGVTAFWDIIELANRLGVKFIISTPGQPDTKKNQIETDALLVDHIRTFIPSLEKLDLKLGIEVHGLYGSGEDVARIVRSINSDRIFVNFDPANAVFHSGVDPLLDLEHCIDLIDYVHLKDKIGDGKQWDFPALGKGDLPLIELMHSLDQVEKEIPASIEIEFTEKFTLKNKTKDDLQIVNQAVKQSFNFLYQNHYIK